MTEDKNININKLYNLYMEAIGYLTNEEILKLAHDLIEYVEEDV